MKEIKSANDIIVVPVSYFNGMEKELQKILNKVDIHDMMSWNRFFICGNG